ncbi:MAG TPA: hypothetical protein VGS41_17460 [Chthonomonadales bacterium]|nr:hypothetical protein [Chthonomonadales bacterium]
MASLIRRWTALWSALGNPRTLCSERYVQDGTVDIACLFESGSGLMQLQMPAWASKRPPERFCVQQYRVGTAAAMRPLVSRVGSLGVGSLFLTQGAGPNSYSRLPPYWDDEAEAASKVGGGA